MGFIDELRMRNTFDPNNQYQLPSPRAQGITGPSLDDQEQFHNRQRTADFEDWKARSIFANNLNNPRLHSIFPADSMFSNPASKPMDVNPPVYLDEKVNKTPAPMTDYQKGELDLNNRKLALDKTQGENVSALKDKEFNNTLGLKQKEYELNQQKSNQIHDTKMADMQRKADEADKKLELAQSDLNRKQNDATSLNNFHNARLEADTARHNMELAQRDKQIADLKAYRDAQLADKQNPTTKTTELNPDGTTKTETTTKGFNPLTHTKMIGPDGKPYIVPKDKVNDAANKGMKVAN